MKRILCPVDFSETSMNGLKYAFEMAKELGSELILFHSVSLPIRNPEEHHLLPEDLTSLEEQAKDKLEIICEKMEHQNEKSPISYHFIVRTGFAKDAILNLIKEKNTDLVILGTKGAHGIDKLLSTVSANLALHSPCPVIIVPENHSYKKISRIVYATDMRDKEDGLVNYVISLAKVFKAHISFLNIQEEEPEDTEQIIREGLQLMNESDYQDISFHIAENKNVQEGIHSFISDHHGDLLVMATAARNALQRIFHKSKTRQEAYRATVPLPAMQKEGVYHFH